MLCGMADHRGPRVSEIVRRSPEERRDLAKDIGPDWADAGAGAAVAVVLAVAVAIFASPEFTLLVCGATAVLWVTVVAVAMGILRTIPGGLSAGTRIVFGFWLNAF